ncbi:unnamed protein product [Dicrocoelium dendriticum]|nr:unnamed protein product [Dicrocoelium dendriticum]
MISMLPKRVLKLLEFVGFSGDRTFGLNQLRLGASMQGSLRAPLCALLLLVYDLYATQMLGDTVSSVAFEKPDEFLEVKQLLEHWRQIYPTSAIFQLLVGRYQSIAGDIEQAIQTYETSLQTPVDWTHYRHMCYWELLWCYALRAQWLLAVGYAERLAQESQWSQATYRYMTASFLIQYLDDPGANFQVTDDKPAAMKSVEGLYSSREQIYQKIDKLLIDVPKLMQRFAGRSLPLEKIALRKSKRYFAQNKRLTLPALELLYIWNGFKMIQCQLDSVMSFLMICENKINELMQHKDQYENHYDDYCLALLLKGVCLRCRGQTFQASMCFQEIVQLKKSIKIDTYLLPFCEMELCQLSFDEGDMQQAVKHLERAFGYRKYSLESRLHFRMHEMESKLEIYRRKLAGTSKIKKMGSDNNIFPQNQSNSQASSPAHSAGGSAKPDEYEDSESDVDSSMLKPMFPEFDDDAFEEIDVNLSSEGSMDAIP